ESSLIGVVEVKLLLSAFLDHFAPRVTRFSSRSAYSRRMMGSGRPSVSICFTTLLAFAGRF
ncbi:hypothetical protein, partial [Consotaella aegiceratis]|uniref:hypothetical protein n=1 Tax=Consotaella aegiceratis TaxID=3097961 RepID=UPI002F3E4913